MNSMNKKDSLQDAAFQQFDQCVEKHMQKIKNFLNGIIYHAYSEGVRDGKRSAWEDAQTVDFALETLKDHGMNLEPRLMTIGEVHSVSTDNIFWFEWYDMDLRHDDWAMVDRRVMMDFGGEKPLPCTEIKFFGGGGWCCYDEHYNRTAGKDKLPGWRCWTGKPTEDIRGVTPWVMI